MSMLLRMQIEEEQRYNTMQRGIWLDGFTRGQKNVTNEVIELIENKFVDSLDDLKELLSKNK